MRAGGKSLVLATALMLEWSALPLVRAATAAGAENASGMGFVDDQHAVMAARDRDQVIKRRRVAIQGIEALGGEPRAARVAVGAPAAYHGVEISGIVVSR